jgi:Fe-Mn family superoxide dismutase
VKFEVPPLPYAKSALAPHISARTLEFHYEKHHKGYMQKLRKIVEGKPEERSSLVDLIRSADGALFNNAAQVWNHTFYWRSMRPNGGGSPTGELRSVLERAFGSVDAFKRELAEAANGEFGSGWAWLVKDQQGKLRVQNSSDAQNPIQRGLLPLCTIDVWEHAYYLDVQNERSVYVQRFLDHLIHWDFIAENLQLDRSAAEARGESR